MNKVICRELELSRIQTRLASESTEFVVVYGRRRVGKTWLVRNSIPMFLDRDDYVYLEVTGTISDDSRMSPSKESFYNSLNLSWSISFGELLFDPSVDYQNINIESLFFLKLAEKIYTQKKQNSIFACQIYEYWFIYFFVYFVYFVVNNFGYFVFLVTTKHTKNTKKW